MGKGAEAELYQKRDPGSITYVLLFDHNKRCFVAYDGEEEDFLYHPENWLDVPIDEVAPKENAILCCLKSKEALERNSPVKFDAVVRMMDSQYARYISFTVIPDGFGLCFFHCKVLAEILIR